MHNNANDTKNASATATASAPLTQGSYHSLLSADQTLTKDTPSISPRSLVKYLDSYVVGQTRAKKVLAVGVWNHYLRVASNQRMRNEREQRLEQQQEEERLSQQQLQPQPPEEHQESRPPAWSESVETSRNLRLGKYKQTISASSDRTGDDENWLRHKEIREQRNAEKVRDPHGEAMRSLMFGRGEREWLYNVGGPSALNDAHDETLSKFGDEAEKWDSARTRAQPPLPRVTAKTPAEEAALSLREQAAALNTNSSTGAAETREALLAEAASRTQDSGRPSSSDAYGTKPSSTAAQDKAMTIGVFGGEASYFSSNNEIDCSPAASKTSSSEPATSTKASRSRDPASKSGAKAFALEAEKWGSAEERQAHAVKLTEERTRRALQDARERLSSPSRPHVASSQASTEPNQSVRLSRPPPPSTHGIDPNFLSTSPGTLPFFEKSNILLLGPSGSGKTLLLRTLAQALEVPFVHVDATPLTMAGYVGEDVESIIQRLLVESGWDVERAQRGIICIDEVDKLRKTSGGGSSNSGRDVGGEGVQQALLRMLEGTIMQIADKSGASASSSAAGGSSMPATGRAAKAQQQPTGVWPGRDASQENAGPEAWYNHRHGKNSSDASNPSPSGNAAQQGTTFQIDTSSILFVLSGAFVGIEDTIRKRLSALSPHTTSAPPELASSSQQKSQPSPEAQKPRWTQTDLLARLEPVDLQNYGLIPEFVGRVPVSVVLNPLTHQDLVRIMTEPKNSLVDQYKALFKINGIELHISPGAIEEIVHRAMGTVSNWLSSESGSKDGTKTNREKSSVVTTDAATAPTNGGGGARSLRRIMEDTLLDAFYESYGSDSSVQYILVDRECVQKQHLGVKLFSRGQKFDFEAQCRADAETQPTKRSTAPPRSIAQHKTGQYFAPMMSPERVKQARQKARRLVRCRVRVTNRLADPIIYI